MLLSVSYALLGGIRIKHIDSAVYLNCAKELPKRLLHVAVATVFHDEAPTFMTAVVDDCRYQRFDTVKPHTSRRVLAAFSSRACRPASVPVFDVATSSTVHTNTVALNRLEGVGPSRDLP